MLLFYKFVLLHLMSSQSFVYFQRYENKYFSFVGFVLFFCRNRIGSRRN